MARALACEDPRLYDSDDTKSWGVDQIQHKTTGGFGPQVVANGHKFSPFFFPIFIDWVQNRISFHGQLIDRRSKQKDLWATGREDLIPLAHSHEQSVEKNIPPG